ncbi:MAG: polysaccharide biosynthesis tyrosine autokinase [Francisellaceae bacterium]
MSKEFTQDDSKELDLRAFIQIVLSRKKTILISIFVFAMLTFLYGISRAPQYRTNMLLNISDNGSAGGSLNAVISNIPILNYGRNMAVDKQIELLKSRSVLLPVIDALDLNISATPIKFPFFGKYIARHYDNTNVDDQIAAPWFGLSKYNWGGAAITVSQLDVSNPWLGRQFILKYKGDGRYDLLSPVGQRLIEDAMLGKSYVYESGGNKIKIEVSALKGNPGEEFVVAKLRDDSVLNTLSASLDVSEMSKDSNILSLSYSGGDPEQITEILNDIGQSAVMSDIKRSSEAAGNVLSFLKKQLPKVQQQLNDAQTKLNDYRSKTGNISISDETKLVLQALTAYDTQLSDLELKKSQLAQKLTENNPEFKQIDAAIEKVKSQRASLEAKVRQMPQSDQVFINLTREVEIQGEVYKNILQKIQQYEILQAGTVSTLQVVDSAEIPYANQNKPTYILVILAMIMGGVLSTGWVFLQTYLFKGVQNPDDIEGILQSPSLGTLFKNKLQTRQSRKYHKKELQHLRVLSEIDPYDATLEGFRSLRTAIMLKALEKDCKTICISGPTQGIGKTFTAVNLASVFALDKKVLLIDADLRRGYIDGYYNTSNKYGLSDYLKGNVDHAQIISKTRFQNLDIIKRGTTQSNSSGLLLQKNYKFLLDFLINVYDYIIIDAPPLLPVADASVIMQQSAMNILVFSCSQHDMREIRLTRKKLDQTHISVDGFVFNNVTDKSHYYLAKYQYNYRYKEA